MWFFFFVSFFEQVIWSLGPLGSLDFVDKIQYKKIPVEKVHVECGMCFVQLFGLLPSIMTRMTGTMVFDDYVLCPLLRSGFWFQGRLLALDGWTSPQHPAGGHGTCGLFLPQSCHRLLLGCCPDPARTLVRPANMNQWQASMSTTTLRGFQKNAKMTSRISHVGLKLTRTSDPNLPMTFHFLFQSLAAEQQKLFFFFFFRVGFCG